MAAKKKAPSATDLLGSLVASASPKTTETSTKKDNIQTVSSVIAQLVEEYTASALIATIAEQQKKADEVELKRQGFDSFVDQWADQGHKPENPIFKSQHASVRLQVKGPYKVALPPDAPMTVEALTDALPEGIADALAGCVKVESNLTCRALDKLMDEGTAEEQAAAKAAIKALSGLSAEHRALVLETKPKFTVDADRLGAILAGECQQNAELMKQVLGIIAPQLALSQPKNEKALEIAAERFKKAAEPVAKAA